MTRLSVNINKVALIRNARGSNLPDLKQFAVDCESFGAEGITVHPRPDERHIRYSDIPVLKEVVKTEFNIEGYPNESFTNLVVKNKPHQVTLVPDPPGVLTSSEGWQTIKNYSFLKDCIKPFKDAGIRVSLFLDARPELVEAAAQAGADRIELYTGDYANSSGSEVLNKHIATAKEAQVHKLGVNAGHDLNLLNLKNYSEKMPYLLEVSIGHALVTDALYYGIQNTIGMYKRLLK